SSAAYNITGAVRLQGALDRVVAQHESLRKHFIEQDGVPMQIAGAADYAWREEEVVQPLDMHIDALSNAPFDLEHGPLLRATLLRNAPDDHVLHVAIHHIVSDGLSINVFVDEFMAAYGDACGMSRPARINVTPRQFNTAITRRGSVNGSMMNRWPSSLRTGAQNSAVNSRCSSCRSIARVRACALRPALRFRVWCRARLLMRCEGCRNRLIRRFSRLCWQHIRCCSRYSGQDDIRVGVPMSGA
ncbi:putative non-ribosomal peptide synthetase, partial [Candidatus Burkholderia humilis]